MGFRLGEDVLSTQHCRALGLSSISGSRVSNSATREVRKCACVHVCMHAWMDVGMYVCSVFASRAYTHTCTHMYTYIHTYVHTNIQTDIAFRIHGHSHIHRVDGLVGQRWPLQKMKPLSPQFLALDTNLTWPHRENRS